MEPAVVPVSSLTHTSPPAPSVNSQSKNNRKLKLTWSIILLSLATTSSFPTTDLIIMTNQAFSSSSLFHTSQCLSQASLPVSPSPKPAEGSFWHPGPPARCIWLQDQIWDQCP